ncbi:MAG: isoprenylcysteine carboxylmethyltransferase family protein [Candidatus Binatia bacterium]
MASSPSSDTAAAPSGLDAAIIAWGNIVFRHRNAMAPIALGAMLLLTRPRQLGGSPRADALLDVVGILVALSGQLLRILVIGLAYIQRGGKNRTIAADTLVVEGIFAHVRHPLYVGNFLLLAGLTLIWNAPAGYGILVLGGLSLFSMARAEEAFLSRKFGADFDAFCRRVPRFIPNFRGLGDTIAGFTFDWKRVIRKEYGTMFAFASCVLAFLAIEWTEWHGAAGFRAALAVLLPVWLVVFAAWGTARWMKKTRRLASPD